MSEFKFNCISCDYHTSEKNKYERHCLTDKHINLHVPMQKGPRNFGCKCGKTYKHSSTLYAHKKKCNFVSLEKVNEELKEDMKRLICQNNDLN